MKPGNYILQIIFLLLISLTVSCDEKNTGIEPDQKVVFEVNYANSAWVKQFKGFLVDKNGVVRTYDNPVSWNSVKESPEISVSQMEENFLHTLESQITVPLLEIYASKIADISSNYSKPVRVGADHGIISYYAYLFDIKKQAYIPILLGQTGDTEVYNTDKNATEIFEWLSEINQNVYE
jgi:hypothetical protein